MICHIILKSIHLSRSSQNLKQILKMIFQAIKMAQLIGMFQLLSQYSYHCKKINNNIIMIHIHERIHLNSQDIF